MSRNLSLSGAEMVWGRDDWGPRCLGAEMVWGRSVLFTHKGLLYLRIDLPAALPYLPTLIVPEKTVSIP